MRVLVVRASERGTRLTLAICDSEQDFKDIVIKQADKCSVQALIVTFDVVLQAYIRIYFIQRDWSHSVDFLIGERRLIYQRLNQQIWSVLFQREVILNSNSIRNGIQPQVQSFHLPMPTFLLQNLKGVFSNSMPYINHIFGGVSWMFL